MEEAKKKEKEKLGVEEYLLMIPMAILFAICCCFGGASKDPEEWSEPDRWLTFRILGAVMLLVSILGLIATIFLIRVNHISALVALHVKVAVILFALVGGGVGILLYSIRPAEKVDRRR